MAFHARTNSLPPRPHPLVSLLDEQLTGLRAPQSASTSSSLTQNLNILQDLYDSAEKLLQLQSSLDRDQADELLEGSLRILDLCTTAKDALSHTKECLQQIQSILRRRRGNEMELVKEAKNYLSSKKTIRKAILKSLKHKENKQSSSSTSTELVGILKEVEVATSKVLQALLFFIAGPESESKKSHWSSVAKIFGNKRAECEKEQDMSEVANAEAAMRSLTRGGPILTENLQSELQKSESCMEDLQEAIDSLFRRLIKSRVTLLNILN